MKGLIHDPFCKAVPSTFRLVMADMELSNKSTPGEMIMQWA